MRLVLFTPPATAGPRETQLATAMLRRGLTTLHVRKPADTPAQLHAYISAIPPELHSRLVVHQHHHLAAQLALKGVHYPERHRPPPPLPPLPASTQSTSFHSLAALAEPDWGALDYAFLSPIYDSISKEGYPSAAFDPPLLRASLAACRVPIIALGGVTKARIPELRELGFAGAAVLGGVWQAADPLAAFQELQEAAAACQ